MTVTVSFPPDTDTPGFADENKDKPEETRLISEDAGLHKADEVGSACLHDTLVSKNGFQFDFLYCRMGSS